HFGGGYRSAVAPCYVAADSPICGEPSLEGAVDDQLGDPVVVVAEDVREYFVQMLPQHRSPPRRMAGCAPEPDRAAFHPRRGDHGVRNLAKLSAAQEVRADAP